MTFNQMIAKRVTAGEKLTGKELIQWESALANASSLLGWGYIGLNFPYADHSPLVDSGLHEKAKALALKWAAENNKTFNGCSGCDGTKEVTNDT